MSTVTLTVGIPASGKTTWARREAAKNDNIVIVSRDDIRHAHGWKSGFDENRVTQIHRNQIEVALLHGYDVIVADTNINPTFRRRLIKFCHEHGADVKLKLFTDCNLDVAISRDESRVEHKVGSDVVFRFYNDLMQQSIEEVEFPCPRYENYKHAFNDPALVVDIDGTLAHMVSRGPYDESRVIEDEYDSSVGEAVMGMAERIGAVVLVVSGRTDKCRDETEQWLRKYDFGYDQLIMRKHGDQRPDYVVKNEIYDTEIIPNYDVIAVFDDRDQVVRHLRARGITVFQVAPGRF